MFLDLDNTLTINVKAAELLGLNTAVYWSGLTEVLKKVAKKKTYDENGFFKLDRDYIKSITTLSADQQKECDNILNTVGAVLINPDDTDSLSINVKAIISLIVEEDLDTLKCVKSEAKKRTKAAVKAGKLAGQIEGQWKIITEGIEDEALLAAYRRWVEAVITKWGPQTKANLVAFREAIEKSITDKEVYLAVLDYAAVKAYRVAEWAINYVCSHQQERSIVGQKISDGKVGKAF